MMNRRLQRPLIAVVDDDASAGLALQQLLQSSGFYAQYHPSAGDFLFSLSIRQPDVVVLDVHLPGMTGLEVAGCLRKMSARIPVMLTTYVNDAEIRQQAEALGIKDVLVKPCQPDELSARVSRALGCPGYVPTRCPWPCPLIGGAVWTCAFSGVAPSTRKRLAGMTTERRFEEVLEVE